MTKERNALVVDDSIVMRQLICDALCEINFNVIAEAENGEEAFDMYKEHDPDLVTMDIVMPREHGIESLKNIMEYNGNANVIVISGLHQKSLLMEALEVGAKDFVVKPFEEDELVETITNIFQ